MSTLRKYIVLFLIHQLLIGCVSFPDQILDVQTPFPTARIKATSTLPPTLFEPTEHTNPDNVPITRTQYEIEVDFDYRNKLLVVDQHIRYLNTTEEELGELLLIIEPNRYPNSFELVSLDWGSGEYVSLYNLENGLLEIPYPNGLLPEKEISIRIQYNINIPFQPSAFGYTSRQTNLADWYPTIPPYRSGEGWLFHQPGQVGEHQIYDLADYRVTIRSPEPRLRIAAPVPGELESSGLTFRLDAARGFIWSASFEYQTVQLESAQTTLVAYVFPEHVAAAEYALDAMADAIILFEELFGIYPREYLTLIEADFYDGYESDGAFFLDEVYFGDYFRSPNNYLTILAAHETAHQWWYAQVGSNQALEPWLDEAISTYCELLFYERYYPDQTGWWWQFRVQRLDPVGYVNSGIYDYDDVDLYVNAVYLRGVSFLRDLRVLIGDEAFFATLRDYFELGHYQQMTTDDFFSILESHTSEDISFLLTVYFTP